MQKKGCDASNMFDEEVLVTEQDHSDDEMEKEAKRLKKLQQKRKHARPDGLSEDEDLEDGEVPNEQKGAAGRGQRGGGRGQRPSRG